MNFVNKQDFKSLWILTVSSIKMFVRNKQALVFTIISPLIIMIIFGLIGFDRPLKLDVGLVTYNPNLETRKIVDQIKSFPSFEIKEGTLDEELKAIREGDRAVIIQVPDDLITNPPQQRLITVFVNESRQTEAQTVVSILNQYLNQTMLSVAGVPSFLHIQQAVVDSRNLKYKDFLLPGLIAMSVMQMSVFSVAFVFTQFKEKGVLKRLVATPMQPYQFVTANVITRLLVSIFQTAVFVIAGILILKATIIGSYWMVLLCVILGAIMFLGLGFTVSGMSKTVDSVPVIANLLIFPMLFLGGVFFPLSSMPDWLQKIAQLLPLTYFSNALREVMTKDAGLLDIKWDIVGMVVWGLILIGTAIVTFRFQEKESV